MDSREIRAPGLTTIEKILSKHSGGTVRAGDFADIVIDVRVARDFGGANVVRNIVENGLGIDDPSKTFFTFDCNPCGSDQSYAANQQKCRLFAREWGIRVFDIDSGIGTHIAMDEKLIRPGGTLVSTDSHANILGAVCAFGQGMGDQDIAHAWARGKVWFKVPPTVRIVLKGTPPSEVTAKDITMLLLRRYGASGLLGFAAEVSGPGADTLTLDERITIASMATEMGAIILLFPQGTDLAADPDAVCERTDTFDLSEAVPFISRPGHPEDVVPVTQIAGRKIDSAFIGSCTNGRYSDLAAAAGILRGRKVAPGVVLKIVPATDEIWRRLEDEGLMKVFKDAGALVGNAGCAGCAAGQIGQNGPGEVTVSTGNRNFPGKQGKGEVFLASPATAVASAVAGFICAVSSIPERPALFETGRAARAAATVAIAAGRGITFSDVAVSSSSASATTDSETRGRASGKPEILRGRAWVVEVDNIDTDMIFHNRYLTITDISKMGQYTFDNLMGWEDFAKKAQPGDIVVAGSNFGCGSSRQQSVDCFVSLGIAAVVASSFGAIYERNAINMGFPILSAHGGVQKIRDGDRIEIDLASGKIKIGGGAAISADPFSKVQMEIYERGGLLKGGQS